MFLLIFILILVALIWVHELGHFTAAKLFGIRVDEFGIGFPPRLLRVQFGGTDYTFNLLLVGGFVRIHGEDPGTDAGDPRSMASKPRFVQATVIVAGVAMNLLVGWLALSAGYMAGMQAVPGTAAFGEVRDARATIAQVLSNSPAEKVGLVAGDKIESLQTGTQPVEQIQSAEQATEYIAQHQNESLVVTVLRQGVEKVFVAKPVEGFATGKKALGVSMADIGVLQLPVHLALLQGAISAKDVTVSTAQGLGIFFSRLVRGVADWGSVAGPVGIAGAGATAVQDGFAAAAFITALISINLAIINLVPIPGLDGGRLLVIIVEGIIRRPVSPKLITGLSLAGFALIILLMVVVTYHDIARLVG
jgi:regulator of sigma E protease